MTPKEAADLANQFLSVSPDQDREIQDYISVETPRNLQKFIHFLNRDGHTRYFNLARTTLEVRLAEDANKTAIKLSEQTDRLVCETVELRRFTKGLFWLTVALVIFTLVQIIIVFFEDAAKTH
jgi:hypothetical protein